MGSHVCGVGVMLWDTGIFGKGLLVSVSLGLELVEPTGLPAAGCVGKRSLARCVPLLLSPYLQNSAQDVRML